MFKVNEYFEGKVASLAFKEADKEATIGVMAVGEYEFGTGLAEVMSVISGELIVLLPGETEWKSFTAKTSFDVPANSKFQVRVEVETAYFCQYG